MGIDPIIVERLSTQAIDIEGRMPNSSNATFLVTVGDPTDNVKGIYKPLWYRSSTVNNNYAPP